MRDISPERVEQHLVEIGHERAAPLETFYLIRAQAKHIAELEAALRVVSDELEEEVTAKYPDYALKYQRNVQNLKNDMEGVLMARALLPTP